MPIVKILQISRLSLIRKDGNIFARLVIIMEGKLQPHSLVIAP